MRERARVCVCVCARARVCVTKQEVSGAAYPLAVHSTVGVAQRGQRARPDSVVCLKYITRVLAYVIQIALFARL